jgi:hypothetical protein
MGYYALYSSADGNGSPIEPPTDPPVETLESLAVMYDGEEMREALLLDILGEVRSLYPHHQLAVSLTPMDLIGQPIMQQRVLPMRQATVQIVKRP